MVFLLFSFMFLSSFLCCPSSLSLSFSLDNLSETISKFTNPLFYFVHLVLWLSKESLISDTVLFSFGFTLYRAHFYEIFHLFNMFLYSINNNYFKLLSTYSKSQSFVGLFLLVKFSPNNGSNLPAFLVSFFFFNTYQIPCIKTMETEVNVIFAERRHIFSHKVAWIRSGSFLSSFWGWFATPTKLNSSSIWNVSKVTCPVFLMGLLQCCTVQQKYNANHNRRHQSKLKNAGSHTEKRILKNSGKIVFNYWALRVLYIFWTQVLWFLNIFSHSVNYHILDRVLCTTEIYNFGRAHFIFFSFFPYAFDVILKKPLSNQRSQRLTLILPPVSFRILALKFYISGPFGLIFIHSVR